MRNRHSLCWYLSQILREITLEFSNIKKREYLCINSKSNEMINSVLHRTVPYVPTNLSGMFLYCAEPNITKVLLRGTHQRNFVLNAKQFTTFITLRYDFNIENEYAITSLTR